MDQQSSSQQQSVNTMPDTENSSGQSSTQTIPSQTVTNLPPKPDGIKKRRLAVVAGIIFFIILIFSLFVYAFGSFKRAKQLSQPTPILQNPTITPLPEQSDEEKEAESVDTGDPVSDINDLESESSTL